MTKPARLVIRDARVLTMGRHDGPRRGPAAMNDLGVLDRADVVIENGVISQVRTAGSSAPTRDPGPATVIEARGRVLMPGFVDAHTHALWAGDRLDEWDMKRRGAAYLDILKAGGGIMSTVRAVRQSSEAELAAALRDRLGRMLREGTTTIEIKSGYGLTTADELKMLRAINTAASSWPGTVVMTALIGHAIDPQQSEFVRRTITETLPAVHAEFPGIAIDAYCESGAWSLDDCTELFEKAMSLGHPVRVHADQFNALGMTEWAAGHGALSVDHLEATTPAALASLAASDTFGVMLPCAGFHTDGRYANGRAFVDGGGALVLATNLNPGSAPCGNIPMAVALGVRMLGLTPAEAITAVTANPAALLERQSAGTLPRRGIIAPGARADLVLLAHTDERMLAYEFGGNPVDVVICSGAIAWTAGSTRHAAPHSGQTVQPSASRGRP